jgi:hypothetical protein
MFFLGLICQLARCDLGQDLGSHLFLKGAEGGSKIRRWAECDLAFALDEIHDLNEGAPSENHQKEGACCRGALHTGVTVDQHWATGIEFAENLESDLGCPELHIPNLNGLEIIINWYAILVWNRWMKFYRFCTVKNSLNPVFGQPVAI